MILQNLIIHHFVHASDFGLRTSRFQLPASHIPLPIPSFLTLNDEMFHVF
jgi:hypothetical protein